MIAPAVGCRVRLEENGPVGVVCASTTTSDGVRVQVRWSSGRRTDEWEALMHPALVPGSEVLHVPTDPMAKSFGHGTVEQLRRIGGRHQALVDFWDRSHRTWLPWQHLVPVPPLQVRYLQPIPPREGDAEAFRIRNLAYALQQWHANTGALTRLEIDPLPHQIHLVHRILTSGDLNWLIADDVGLGKTIEVGLLLAALRSAGQKRFLMVVPAGLTRQWKEEMRDKFGIADFMIYGDDVTIDDPAQWKLFDRVIVSVDRARMEPHLRSLLQAEPWDLIVFDEAHRLGRDEYGSGIRSTDRYRAAAALRRRTDAVLLLTGTPHQGKDDRFRALLELLRPGREWRQRFLNLRRSPEVLADIVIRNRKADVTDAEGAFVFRGKDVRTVEIPAGEEEHDFDVALRTYLREGYEAGRRGGPTGNAIGFVMTIYRKLAASSYAAIATALRRRYDRLTEEHDEGDGTSEVDDDRYVENEERRAAGEAPAHEFFEGELAMLDRLARQAEHLRHHDAKTRFFVDSVVGELLAKNPKEKLLVFTEYRTTQTHLAEALRTRYGDEAVALIHGGQSFERRRQEIDAFEGPATFLVSTEAGGEGLNLQRACHVMVNYDLPWNPMRLVQRVGRLYRYGQTKRVQVINLNVADSLDHRVLSTMYERLEAVAADMAAVSDEYKEGLHEDILGELVASLDVNEFLEDDDMDEERSRERLEEALRRAREATERQDEILRYAEGYDPNDLAHDLKLGLEHLKSFAEGACARFGVEIAARLYRDTVWDLKLPERLQQLLGSNRNVRIAFERSTRARLSDAEMFGPGHPLYEAFVADAQAYEANGHAAHLTNLDGRAALGAMLRWMDDRGRPLYHEYVGVLLREDGTVDVNHADWARFLLEPACDGPAPKAGSTGEWRVLQEALDRELRERSTRTVHPDTPYLVGVGWIDAPEKGRPA